MWNAAALLFIRKPLKINELVIASTSWDLFHTGTTNMGVFDDADHDEHIQEC